MLYYLYKVYSFSEQEGGCGSAQPPSFLLIIQQSHADVFQIIGSICPLRWPHGAGREPVLWLLPDGALSRAPSLADATTNYGVPILPPAPISRFLRPPIYIGNHVSNCGFPIIFDETSMLSIREPNVTMGAMFVGPILRFFLCLADFCIFNQDIHQIDFPGFIRFFSEACKAGLSVCR